MSRFERDYELTIRASIGDIVVEPPFQVSFDCLKAIDGFGQNKMTIDISNLAERKRLALVKDTEQNINIEVLFKVGYRGSRELIFNGTVQRGSNRREGADFITQLYCLGISGDFLRKFISKSVKADQVGAILSDLQGIRRGKITELQELIRPKVLVGTAPKLLSEIVPDDADWFVDNGALNILKDNEVVSSFIPKVSADTGLLNTPEREQQKVTFETLMNPTIKIGGLVDLQTRTAPHLNGIYKIQTISYDGGNYGDAWMQTCTGYLNTNYRVVR